MRNSTPCLYLTPPNQNLPSVGQGIKEALATLGQLSGTLQPRAPANIHGAAADRRALGARTLRVHDIKGWAHLLYDI